MRNELTYGHELANAMNCDKSHELTYGHELANAMKKTASWRKETTTTL